MDKPKIIKRECGGLLAISPDQARLRIAVTGDTESAAEARFAEEETAWRRLLKLAAKRKAP